MQLPLVNSWKVDSTICTLTVKCRRQALRKALKAVVEGPTDASSPSEEGATLRSGLPDTSKDIISADRQRELLPVEEGKASRPSVPDMSNDIVSPDNDASIML